VEVDNGLHKVTLFAFNDFHRRLNPFPDGSGGAARLVGKLRQLKADHPGSLTVNVGDVAGDNKKPGPQAFAPIAQLFDRAQVDVLALGNHEFEDPQGDYASLRNGLIKPFQGEVLCANVTAQGQPLEGVKPFTIKQLAGFNIALIGVVTRDLSSRVHPAAGAGLSVAPIEDTLAAMVPELDKQSDAVVVLGHENLNEMIRHTQDTPGVDVTLAAHDHKLQTTQLERADGSKAYVSEGGAYGQTINQIDLYFSPQSRQLIKVEVTTHSVDGQAPIDAQAEEIVRNAPQLERASMPEKKSSRDALRLNSFSQLSQWYKTQGTGSEDHDHVH
jgi:2',3'-cyclic-nucleotide 2'-phosphodiesterase (5'-nucleotidase family)